MVPKKMSFPVENPGGERLNFTAEYDGAGYHCVLNFTGTKHPCAFFVRGPQEISTLAAIVQRGAEWSQIKALPESTRTTWLLKLLGIAGVRLAD